MLLDSVAYLTHHPPNDVLSRSRCLTHVVHSRGSYSRCSLSGVSWSFSLSYSRSLTVSLKLAISHCLTLAPRLPPARLDCSLGGCKDTACHSNRSRRRPHGHKTGRRRTTCSSRVPALRCSPSTYVSAVPHVALFLEWACSSKGMKNKQQIMITMINGHDHKCGHAGLIRHILHSYSRRECPAMCTETDNDENK